MRPDESPKVSTKSEGPWREDLIRRLGQLFLAFVATAVVVVAIAKG